MATLDPTPTHRQTAIIVVTPIAVQEMVMAAWFIFKGFNPSAIQPESGARPVS